MIHRLFLIGLAGFAGTLCRYGLTEVVERRIGPQFPLGTVLVNISGCLIAGFLFYPLNEKAFASDIVRTAVMIGFLGGFTTFSSFGVQTFTLARDGEIMLALLNFLLSNVVGLAFVWLGYSLSKLALA